ncbi:sigma-54-dependent Fis family transcriptional regulator [Betaproteobacteria bacterium]|nr:sigma-54-dependent Fis family transcriptional regulator [Betaproteobacteria bacterium]GHU01082.1 sigma-54-dependent Fis family transcriptional regulator [Betaproteobacteria bacterium]GHU08778.1 sigma-54-dependent Fis family transcriptional regulator [Betaproteobacteria bacterium]GHU18005.1 sigma-54-dependent Fis family transcriptional regulator [Betaproteobacteria bacterium]GHU22342.1 sigma-54-dependent Fis family transcriptional regulator [Betaproteobacteria bacterium]
MSPSERRHPVTTHNDVLVVDDEEDIRELLELSLLRMGLGADTAGNLADARQLLETTRYRLCLTDMRLPDGDGLELVEHIQHHFPGLPVAMITAYGSIETGIRAMKLGAFDFVTKPLELHALRELVSHALKLGGASNERAEKKLSAGGYTLVGSSLALNSLRAQIDKLARNQAPVFIQGESGTGKEITARLIHGLGVRASGPFIPVNCGAIPAELMESEFFGYRKGSFSNALTDKDGLFQAANGGTLFLDEVADLPLSMQVKLLRAIQERAVRPVGAPSEQAVDVRILSASHRDLAHLVAENRFRQDLYFRINVIALRVPPLRERLEDIPELAAHVLARLATRDNSPVRTLAPEALALMQQYAFPGNVRELENLLERACALCEGAIIGADDLGLNPAADTAAHTSGNGGGGGGDDIGKISDDERAQVLHALDATRWNRSAAARKLGMTLRQLRYRLQKWGMD